MLKLLNTDGKFAAVEDSSIIVWKTRGSSHSHRASGIFDLATCESDGYYAVDRQPTMVYAPARAGRGYC